MKTITLQGTESQFKNLDTLQFSYGDSDKLPQEVETRVYVIEIGLTKQGVTDEGYLLVDDLFMKEAERQGTVFSLYEFARQFNEEEFKVSNSFQYIRFINIPLN